MNNDNDNRNQLLAKWLPTPGNIIFTLLVVFVLFWANSAGAIPFLSTDTDQSAIMNTSSSTIAYQGYLVDSGGNPVNEPVNITFRLYNVASGGTALWSEAQTVAITDGLFSVLLGSQSPISRYLMAANNNLWLGITVGIDQEMTPREKIASAPFAILSDVADGSITQNHLANNSVTGSKIVSGSVAQSHLANNSVTGSKIVSGSVTQSHLADNSVTASKITNGAIGSNHLQNNAVLSRHLNPVVHSLYATNQVSTSSVSWQDVPGMSFTINVDSNQRIMIWGQASMFQDGTTHFPRVRIVANNVEIAHASARGGGTPGGDWSYDSVPLMGVFQASPGSVVVKMQYRSAQDYGTLYLTHRNLFSMSVGR